MPVFLTGGVQLHLNKGKIAKPIFGHFWPFSAKAKTAQSYLVSHKPL